MKMQEAIAKLLEMTNLDESHGDRIISATLTPSGWTFQVVCYSYFDQSTFTMLFSIDESGYKAIKV